MPATTLADRALVRVAGDDVHAFLQGLVTSDLTGALPVWTGLLTPHGKCLFDFIVWQGGDDPSPGAEQSLLLDCETEAADELAKRLSLYRLRRPIVITRDDSQAVHWSVDGTRGWLDPRLPSLGRRWLGPPDEPATGWLEHRLRLGVCEGRAELGDVLWLECNAAELNGVSFTKGCFVGQENTARMNWRGKVNRRLLVVETAVPAERTRIVYPALGLAVEHRRLDDLAGAIVPDWLAPALP